MTVPLSIVIPVAPGETALGRLLGDLSVLSGPLEILIVYSGEDDQCCSVMESFPSTVPLRQISSAPGRAQQLNCGAAAALGDDLWFLHADTSLTPQAWEALQRSRREHPDDLHYFDLTFHREGPRLMRLNSWGVWLRSHWFRMPFGDQGFCLSKRRFVELGGYDESLPYGEDHAFVWTARAAGLNIRPTGAVIETSARKYQTHGWCRTTLRHLWFTWKQALPLYARLLRKRWQT